MAKRRPKQAKTRRTSFASPVNDKPLAHKVVAELRSFGAKQGNVIDLQSLELVREQIAGLKDDETAAESDPAAAMYLHGIKVMTLLGNTLATHPALTKLMDRIEHAEEEYMPSGPPMSPITHSHFLLWSLLDLPQGLARETLGSIVEAAQRAVAGDADTVELIATLNRSRLGVYVQETASDGNRFGLRELVTGRTGEFACDSGYRGVPGNILLVRALPPPVNILRHGAIIMTPYQIIAPGEDAWLAYFDRTLPQLGIGDPVKAYEHLMKSGCGQLGDRYWMEYIFEAYANHTESTVFLKGLPDVASSRPHAEKTSPLAMQSRQAQL